MEEIRSFKGFEKDMTCRGKQYEEGKDYEEKSACACASGMHACEYPLDCFSYYPPGQSVYHEAATAGYGGAATAGDGGATTAGNRGAATNRGRSASGENGLSVARGNDVRVKGGIGAVLVIVEEKRDSYDIDSWASAVVDGEKIKADTWYKLEGGKFVEVEDE